MIYIPVQRKQDTEEMIRELIGKIPPAQQAIACIRDILLNYVPFNEPTNEISD